MSHQVVYKAVHSNPNFLAQDSDSGLSGCSCVTPAINAATYTLRERHEMITVPLKEMNVAHETMLERNVASGILMFVFVSF